MWFAALQFLVLLQGVAALLWFADTLPLAQSALWVGVLSAGLWAVGAVMQGRIAMLEVLLIEAAALATATSDAGLTGAHHLLKPLVMLIAIVFIAIRAYSTGARCLFFIYLLTALAFSLAGDVFLMLSGYFIPGLVSFLIAHLFYIINACSSGGGSRGSPPAARLLGPITLTVGRLDVRFSLERPGPAAARPGSSPMWW